MLKLSAKTSISLLLAVSLVGHFGGKVEVSAQPLPALSSGIGANSSSPPILPSVTRNELQLIQAVAAVVGLGTLSVIIATILRSADGIRNPAHDQVRGENYDKFDPVPVDRPVETTESPSYQKRLEASQAIADSTGNNNGAASWIATEGNQIAVPTHDQSGSATHPSVLYFPEGWNGWKYWMAMTPYPYGNEAHEDPNVVVSNDGDNWSVPAGLSNPINNQPGKPGPYNSDPQLVMGPKGDMHLIWRTVDRRDGDRNLIYLSTSTDGVKWSSPKMIWRGPRNQVAAFLSPSLVWTGDKWRLYGVRELSNGPQQNVLSYFESRGERLSMDAWGPAIDNVLLHDTAHGAQFDNAFTDELRQPRGRG